MIPKKKYLNFRKKDLEFIEFLPIPVVITTDKIIQYINNSCIDFFQIEDKNKIIGHSVYMFIHKEDSAESKERLEEISNSGNLLNEFVETMTLPSGKTFTITVNSFPVIYKGKISLITYMLDFSILTDANYHINEARLRLQATLNALPDSLLEIDNAGKIYDFRITKKNLLSSLKISRGKNISRMFSSDSQKVIFSSIQNLSKTKDEKEVKGCHEFVFFVEKDGEKEWFEISSSIKSSRENRDSPHFIILLKDVTESVRTKENLQIYKNIVSQADEIIIFTDNTGKIITANPLFYKYIGFEQKVIETENVLEIFDEISVDENKSVKNLFNNSFQFGNVVEEVWLDFPKCGYRIMEVSITQFIENGDFIKGLILRMKDLTEKVKSEAKVLSIGQEERKRIGMELHDGLSHHLLGIAIQSKLLSEELDEKKLPESKMAKDIEKDVKKSLQWTRNIAKGLFPVQLETYSLSAMLQEFKDNLENENNIRCDVTNNVSGKMKNFDLSMDFYYIFQEAISNIIKHSNAKKVSIVLSLVEDKKFILKIIDDGIGIRNIDKEKAGVGISIMKQRAQIIGGTFKINNYPKGGTEITLSLRLNNKK